MRVILTAAILTLLGGCATAYQPTSFTGGFSETQLDKAMFRVAFKGNAFTSTDRAADFTLLRSAEIAIENGYNYFVIIDTKSNVKTSVSSTPISVTSLNGFTTVSGGEVYSFEKPSSTNTIYCYADRPAGVISYDARFIISSISRKYGKAK